MRSNFLQRAGRIPGGPANLLQQSQETASPAEAKCRTILRICPAVDAICPAIDTICPKGTFRAARSPAAAPNRGDAPAWFARVLREPVTPAVIRGWLARDAAPQPSGG
jgi:hypothetical protein